jgi:hypothetical protein
MQSMLLKCLKKVTISFITLHFMAAQRVTWLTHIINPQRYTEVSSISDTMSEHEGRGSHRKNQNVSKNADFVTF